MATPPRFQKRRSVPPGAAREMAERLERELRQAARAAEPAARETKARIERDLRQAAQSAEPAVRRATEELGSKAERDVEQLLSRLPAPLRRLAEKEIALLRDSPGAQQMKRRLEEMARRADAATRTVAAPEAQPAPPPPAPEPPPAPVAAVAPSSPREPEIAAAPPVQGLAADALRLALQRPESVRQALILSEILGRPIAFRR